MKTVLYIVAILVGLFFIVQLILTMSSRKIEQYAYEVIRKYDQFEIRKYESSLFTSIKMNTNDYDQASGRGFSTLANYIFGGNESNDKIAMTSPVAVTLDDTMSMMFMVPKAYKLDDLPAPNNKNIEFKSEPEKVVAAIQFSGWANDKKIKLYREKLRQALIEKQIPYKERFYYLGYNPPYEMINRRNEIIVELDTAELQEMDILKP